MKALEITSYIGCPNMCHYCPQDLLIKKYVGNKIMTIDDFQKILSNVPLDVRIDFTGFSEIFFHPSGSSLIKMACDAGYSVVLYTTLEGFSDNDLSVLSGCRFSEVCFHQYPNVDIDVFNDRIGVFSKNIQRGRVAEITKKWEWSRAGNVRPTISHGGVFRCLFAGKDFDHNVVVPNGDVYICCQDYGLKHKIGNLMNTNFNDMDRQALIDMSNLDKSDILCRNCELMQVI